MEEFNQTESRQRNIRRLNWRDLVVLIMAGSLGFLGGLASWLWLTPVDLSGDIHPLIVEKESNHIREESFGLAQLTHEEKIIHVADQAIPSVVSIIATREITTDPLFYGMGWFFSDPGETTRQETSYGTGFFVSSDGLILTNKHVVLETDAEYQVMTSGNKKYSAKVLARDPVYDLALIKIEGLDFPVLELGDSDKLVPGQTVLAIGNALGQFESTVSSGIISGLSRTISAYGLGYSDTLTDLIQTDAAINHGNSGGPLLDLNGRIMGINVAMAEQAQNLGFAIPINQAKKAIRLVQETGRIIYPFLGINYVMVDKSIQEEFDLPYDYGALIVRNQQTGVAIVPDSAAMEMGLKENDLILEINGEKITVDRTLARIIQEYNPGDEISLKIWREGKVLTAKGKLGQNKG